MNIILQVPKKYKPSKFLTTCSPEDIQLILEYGEKLLHSHKELINMKTTDKTIVELQEQLTMLQVNQNQKIQQSIVDVSRNYIEEINLIKKEKENVIKHHTIELNKMQKSISEIMDKVKQTYTNEITHLRNESKKMCEDKDKIISNLQSSFSTIVESTKNLYTDELAYLKEQITLITKERREEKKKYRKELSKLRNKDNDMKGWMSETFKHVLTYHDVCNTNSQKGAMGEAVVRNLLREGYTNANIIDVSSQGRQGDIRFECDDLNMLVEVKKKKEVTKEDIAKFERDIRNSKNINCAMFVSLNDVCIPNKGDFHIEFMGLPILYLYLRDPSYIKLAVEILKYAKGEKKEGDENNIKKDFEILVKKSISTEATKKKISSIIIQLKKQIGILERIEKTLDLEIKNINEFCDNLY